MTYSKVVFAFCCFASSFKSPSAFEICYNITFKRGIQDAKSDDYVVASFSTSSNSMCAKACGYDYQCSAFFVNKVTKECTLYTRQIEELTLEDANGWVGYNIEETMVPSVSEGPREVWIDLVIDFSSQSNAVTNFAYEIVGPPDVYPEHGDLPGAWASNEWYLGPEWITVKIAEPLFISRIDLYETYNPGGTLEVAVKNPDGNWDVVWTTIGLTQMTKSRINQVYIHEPLFATDELRITIDGSVAEDWVQIDAVKVIGEP